MLFVRSSLLLLVLFTLSLTLPLRSRCVSVRSSSGLSRLGLSLLPGLG